MTEESKVKSRKFNKKSPALWIKSNKKILMVLISSLCILGICVGSTIAYLISLSGPVENVFTIGKVNIELTETTGSTYQLIPGTTVSKNPTVSVLSDSEDCWLFVKITKSENFDEYLTYGLADGWTHLGGYDGIYYRSVDKSGADQKFSVLKDNAITVKDSLTEEKMSAISSPPLMTFKAYAIQQESIESALDAWKIIAEEGE